MPLKKSFNVVSIDRPTEIEPKGATNGLQPLGREELLKMSHAGTP